MRKLFTLLVIALLFNCTAQAQLNKRIGLAAALQFTAGAFDGVNQAYLFHYDNGKFLSIKPNSEAWSNKWKIDVDGNVLVGQERFFGSSTFLVWTTDFYHFTRFAKERSNELSMLTYGFSHLTDDRLHYRKYQWRKKRYRKIKKKKWYWYAADAGILFVARSAGFHLMYSGIYK